MKFFAVMMCVGQERCFHVKNTTRGSDISNSRLEYLRHDTVWITSGPIRHYRDTGGEHPASCGTRKWKDVETVKKNETNTVWLKQKDMKNFLGVG